MRRLRRSTIFFLILLLTSMGGSAVLAQGVITQKHILDNGLTVLISSMPESSSVSVYGLIKTGSANEGVYLGAGLTHFMEHMIFKGTERRGVGEIPKEIQSLGGTVNASTHFDYTIYTLTLPRKHGEQAFDILSDMLMNPKFDPQEIEREREVIFREMRMHRDRPERYLSDHVFQTVYYRHPYRLPIIGYEDLLRPLTRDDFLAYYRLQYVPNNMILSIAGGIDHDEALALAKQYFGKYARGLYSTRKVEAEPDQTAQRQRDEYYATEVLRMSVSYQGVNVVDDDMVALDALARILGAGRGSRLYQVLKEEKKLIHSVRASNFTPQDRGLFEIEITSENDNAGEILAEIDTQIKRIIRKGVDKNELQKVVSAALKSSYQEDLVSHGVAYQRAVNEAVTGKFDFNKWYNEQFEKLRSDDLVEVAKKYLRKDRRSVVILRPDEWKAERDGKADPTFITPAIERVVLDNGITVLLRVDKTVPMMWVNFVVNGGAYVDPAGKNGLAKLTARLWTKGSRRFSKDMIDQMTAQKAVGFSAFSGNQSMGLRMNFLSRDVDFAFNLLSDTVMNPLFDAQTLADEKRSVQTSILNRDNQLYDVAHAMAFQSLFKGHPMAYDPLGTKESVDQIKREDVVEFYERTVLSSPAVISVFGDFDRDNVLQKIQRNFKGYRPDADDLVASDLSAHAMTQKVDKIKFLDKEQALVMYAFQGEGFYHQDRFGLEVLGAIIGSPFKGKMFSTIREKMGLAYTLGGGFAPYKDVGALTFFIKTLPENADTVKQAFLSLIDDIHLNGITAEELSAIKAYLIGRHSRTLDDRSGVAFLSALDELYGLGYDWHQKYNDHINAVSLDDIKRLAQQYLDPTQVVVVMVSPDIEP